MANQMIALQARGPQLPDMGAQLARFGNMMARQQVANRQSEVAQQTMDIARANEARDAYADKIKMNADKIDYYTIRAGQTMTPEGYAGLLQDLDKDAPDIAAHFRANLPEANFDRNMLLRMVGSIGDNFKATYGPLETEVVTLEDGTIGVARTGGFGGPGAEPGVFELEKFKLGAGAPPVAAPPPAAGAPPQTPPQTPTGGMLQPISYTGGQPQGAGPHAELAKGMEDAMRTKQISSELVDQLRQIDPRASAAVDQFLQTNNIRVLPGGGMRSAVYRPGVDGPPQMQQVQDMRNYRPTGQAARAKDPMQAPTPGSAIVPIDRVRREAAAGRETPAEAAAKARAVAAVAADADIAKQERQRAPARKQVSTLVGKVRNAYEALEKAQAIPSEKRGGFANAMDYMATSSAGREAQKMVATNESKYLSEITNSRKLLATAIKNATGMTAQEMNSNVELTLMLDALTNPTQGIEAARSTLDTLEELFGSRTAPSSGARGRTSTDRSVDSNNPLLRD